MDLTEKKLNYYINEITSFENKDLSDGLVLQEISCLICLKVMPFIKSDNELVNEFNRRVNSDKLDRSEFVQEFKDLYKYYDIHPEGIEKDKDLYDKKVTNSGGRITVVTWHYLLEGINPCEIIHNAKMVLQELKEFYEKLKQENIKISEGKMQQNKLCLYLKFNSK